MCWSGGGWRKGRVCGLTLRKVYKMILSLSSHLDHIRYRGATVTAPILPWPRTLCIVVPSAPNSLSAKYRKLYKPPLGPGREEESNFFQRESTEGVQRRKKNLRGRRREKKTVLGVNFRILTYIFYLGFVSSFFLTPPVFRLFFCFVFLLFHLTRLPLIGSVLSSLEHFFGFGLVL